MSLKDYLNRATLLNDRIVEILNRAEMLRKSLYGRGLSYENDGTMSGRPCSDTLARAIAKIVDFESKADELIDELITVKIEIEDTLDLLSDSKLRVILERKYIYFETNEVIAASLNYTTNHVYKLQNKALKELEEKWIKNDSEMIVD